jgi:hypothetical protein
MGKLILHLADGATREIALDRERLTIGRRPDNDVCLPYPAVSGEHAAVVTILDDSFLEDLRSTNGTLVNGKAITKHFLRDGDEIDVGRHKLTYFSGAYSPATRELPIVGGGEIALELPSAESPAGASDTDPNALSRGEGTLPLHSLMSPSVGNGSVDTAAMFATASAQAPVAADDRDHDGAPADAPTLEVLDGPSAGQQFTVGREDFVIGRVGEQIAVVRRIDAGFRLVALEGESVLRLNGELVPSDGATLSAGDEIEIAGTRIRYRAAA